MKKFVRQLVSAAWLAGVWFCVASPLWAQTPAPLAVTIEPERLFNGSPCVFRVTAASHITKVTGTWMWRRLFFTFDSQTRTWYGVGGVGPETAPARYPLVIEATLTDGTVVTSTYQVPVEQIRFPFSYLSVDPDFLNPTRAQRARIVRERELKGQLFQLVSPQALWETPFSPPLAAVVTEPFGARRMFNGKRRGLHQGLDYRAPLGTPVTAMNSGKVILARNLFFEGNCVVLDHGHGLLTMYLHFSAFKIKEGERVKRGQLLGLSGESGRTTGPHLHVGVRWQGIYVDPLRLYALALP
jgi:murein DD-endopeptidase MepM/ murein hydrolase activator NlpD